MTGSPGRVSNSALPTSRQCANSSKTAATKSASAARMAHLFSIVSPNRPTDEQFPFMLEIFSRKPEGIDLGEDQTIVPIPLGEDTHSLSAILVDDDYHALIREHSEVRDGVSFVTATGLNPRQNRAPGWTSVQRIKPQGQRWMPRTSPSTALRPPVAGTPPRYLGDEDRRRPPFSRWLPRGIQGMAGHSRIDQATLGGNLKPASLRSAIQTYFRLT